MILQRNRLTVDRVSISKLKHIWTGAVVLGALVFAGSAWAEEIRQVVIELKVMQLSHQPGPIDPNAQEVHLRLQPVVKYQRIIVLQRHQMKLQLKQMGTMKLPTGSMVQLRPIKIGPEGVTMVLDWEGALKTTLRVPNQETVMIRGQRFENGNLVLELKPRY